MDQPDLELDTVIGSQQVEVNHSEEIYEQSNITCTSEPPVTGSSTKGGIR